MLVSSVFLLHHTSFPEVVAKWAFGNTELITAGRRQKEKGTVGQGTEGGGTETKGYDIHLQQESANVHFLLTPHCQDREGEHPGVSPTHYASRPLGNCGRGVRKEGTGVIPRTDVLR